MATLSPAGARKLADLSVEEWIALQRRLILQERDAEIAQTYGALSSGTTEALQAVGICIPKLTVLDTSSGLFGRTVLTLGFPYAGTLPAHKFSSGDVAGLLIVGSGTAKPKLTASGPPTSTQIRSMYDASGVVLDVRDTTITVTIDEQTGTKDGDDTSVSVGDKVRLDKLADDVTFRRLSELLTTMEKADFRSATHLLSFLFGPPQSTGEYLPPREIRGAVQVDKAERSTLNESQVAAVNACLAAEDIAMIHGPPGTGKTTTVVEYVQREAKCGRRVIACAPSNVAVDNIALRLRGIKDLRIVRLGHPARVMEAISEYSLDALVERAEGTSIVQDVRKELSATVRNIRKERDKAARRALRGEEKRLKSEIRAREERVVLDILKQADVVLATVTGAATKLLLKALSTTGDDGVSRFKPFDVVVIDEVAQGMECACMIPVLLGKKLVVAGDHLQLPPTIIDDDAAAQGLGFTLADRIVQRYGNASHSRVVHLLNTQYRMHSHIMRWSNELLYNNKLLADDSVKAHLLTDLSHFRVAEDDMLVSASKLAETLRLYDREIADTSDATVDQAIVALRRDITNDSVAESVIPAAYLRAPVIFVDTAGCGFLETTDGSSDSKANVGEAVVVLMHLHLLLSCGLKPAEVAIVTPYNAQVALLRAALAHTYPAVEVRSVDGFQGQEKEAILLSLVRSNHKKEIGFLRDLRRLNVAVTRARRHLLVVGDSDTVVADDGIKKLLDCIAEMGVSASAAEYFSVEYADTRGTAAASTSSILKQQQSDALQEGFTTVLSKFKNACEAKLIAYRPGNTHVLKHDRGVTPKLTVQFREASAVIECPTSFSANERRILHLVCEALELQHQSTDTEHGRMLTIRIPLPGAVDKPPTTKAPAQAAATISITKGVEDVVAIPTSDISAAASTKTTTALTNTSAAADATISSRSDDKMPPAATSGMAQSNTLLQQLHDKRVAQQQLQQKQSHRDTTPATLDSPSILVSVETSKPKPKDAVTAPAKQQKASSDSTSAAPSKTKQKSARPKLTEEEEWALIEEAAAAKDTCGGSGCKKPVATSGTNCKFCNMRYCYKHALPEAHGCDEAAREAARSAWLASAGGAGVKSIRNETDRATALRELHRKIDAAGSSRAPADKSKASKK